MGTRNNLVIGVDISTSACKTMIWDMQGNLVAEGRKPIPMKNPQTHWYEQSAEDWWIELQNTLKDASSKIDLSHLAAICICPQRETFVPVDTSNQPIYNAILWMDERAHDLLPKIKHAFSNEKFHQITGKPLSGNLTIAKILWLRENEPAIFEKCDKFLDVAAYLNHKLTGAYVTGWGIADPTGLFDMRINHWSLPILDFLGLRIEQLPQAFPAGTIIGRVTPQAARLCGLPTGLPVVAGLGDGQAAGLGANINQSGKTYLSLGTSVVSGTYAKNFITNRAFRSMYGADGTFSLETVLLGGTYTLDWVRDKFTVDTTLADLENQSRRIPPGSDGLIVVPYWNSVMNPYWDSTASGITIGWRGHHSLAHFYQAILEGIAFELRLHFEGLEAALKQNNIEQIIAMGGGTRSESWCQIIADVNGRNIQLAQIPEATALGAGILAAIGAGLFSDLGSAVRNMTYPPIKTFIPNPDFYKIYTRLYEQVYKPLYPTLRLILQQLENG